MKCPNCHTVFLSPQQAWQERMQAIGRCIQCGKTLLPTDYINGRQPGRCQRCRGVMAAAARRRHARRRGVDLLRTREL